MVAVELVARDTRGSLEAVLSLGCIQYDSTRYIEIMFIELCYSLYIDNFLPDKRIHNDDCSFGDYF